MVKFLHSTNSDHLCSLVRMPLGRDNIVKKLILCGAKINHKANNGKTALQTALENGKTKNTFSYYIEIYRKRINKFIALQGSMKLSTF